MTPRGAQFLTALLGTLFTAAGVILLAVVPADALGPFRWSIGLPLLAVGVVNLVLVPRFSREVLPPDADFRPLDERGQPVLGSPTVRQVAVALERELQDTPHSVETAADAVRVAYDSGTFVQPGGRSLRRFRWRTTLAATRRPGTFLRLDQQVDEERGLGWRTAALSGGAQWSTHARTTVDASGRRTTQQVSTSPVTDAVRVALREASARQALSTMAVVGIANGSLGILIALGAVVGAVLL